MAPLALSAAVVLLAVTSVAALTSGPAETFNAYISSLNASSFAYNPNALGLVETSSGGASSSRQLKQWPTLANMGISQTAFVLDGCALRPPHAHMRATGLLYVIQANNLSVGFVSENGTAFTNSMTSGASTVFPQGLVHFQQNLDCNPAYYLITYNNEDPGTQVTYRAVAMLPSSVISASLGGSPAASFTAEVPTTAFASNTTCVARCAALGVNTTAPSSLQNVSPSPAPAASSAAPAPAPAPSNATSSMKTSAAAPLGSLSYGVCLVVMVASLRLCHL